MEIFTEPVRPNTFEPYREYLYIEQRDSAQEQIQTPVKFYAYDPCPAFVIVCNQMGDKWRCPRDKLFTNTQSGRA